MSEIINVNGKDYINGTRYTLNDDGTFVCEDGRILYYACNAKDKKKLEIHHRSQGEIYGISDPQRNAVVYGDIEYALKMFNKGVIVNGDLYLDRGDAEFVKEQIANSEVSYRRHLENEERRKKKEGEALVQHMMLMDAEREYKKKHPLSPKYNPVTRFLFKALRIILLLVLAVIVFLIIGEITERWQEHRSKSQESSSEEYWEERAYKVPDAQSSWVEVSEEYNIGPDAELTYNDRRFVNFSDAAVRGVDATAPAEIRTDEADRGFKLMVMDADTVYAQAYNHTDEDIKPLYVQVQSWDGDYEAPIVEGDEGVIISGYKNAPDGFGCLVMYFSNGESLALGVYKQNGNLYAFNILPVN